MTSSVLSVVATLVITLICSNLVAADCSEQLIFPQQFSSPLDCGGDGGGSELRFTENSISFRAFQGSPGEEVPELGIRLPDRLRLDIARQQNGALHIRKSSVTIDGRRVMYKDDKDIFETYFQLMQLIIWKYETGDCPIDTKGQMFPELAPIRGSLATLAALFGVIDCIGLL